MRNRSDQDPESVAISALGFIASDAERLDRFLGLTGIDASEIRTAASSPGFLAAVLDHIMEDERLLVAFAGEAALSPETIPAARHALARG
jgi:hypothetical protein